jgi:ComEC/Rec2-related protein
LKQKLPYFAVLYSVGLLLASYLPWRTWGCVGLLAMGLLLLLVGWKRLHWKTAILLFLTLLCGMGWYQGYTMLRYEPVMQYAEQETVFTGYVIKQTCQDNDKATYQIRGSFPDGTTATILCYTTDFGCEYGDLLTVSGQMTVPEETYLFSGTSYYRAKGIFLQAAYDATVTWTPVTGYTLHRKLIAFREQMQAKLLRLAGTEDGGLMISMLFGQKQFLDDTVKQAFYRSGIGHILSVSGLHMVLLLMPLSLLRKNRQSQILRFLFSCVIIGMFTILTESPVSVLRAGCMVLLAQGGVFFYRRSSAGSALAFAVLVLTLPQPYLIRDVSFQLSVSGTFGISIFAPYLTRHWQPKHLLGQFGKSILTMFLVFCCLLPVSSQYFSEVSLLSPLTNVILMPFCSLLLLFTVCTVWSGGVLANIFSSMAIVCCDILTTCVSWLDRCSFWQIPISSDLLPMLLLLSTGLIVFLFYRFPNRKWLCILLSGQMGLLVVIQVGQYLERQEGVWISAFGQKSNAVIIVQSGDQMDVIDMTGANKNASYVKQYLQQQGVHHLQSLTILQNAPHMGAVYDTALSGVTVDAVLFPTDAFVRQQDCFCGQQPQQMEQYTITTSNYTLQWVASSLQIDAAGQTLTISLETAEALLADTDAIQIQIAADGTIKERTLCQF